jgi:MFS family permease
LVEKPDIDRLYPWIIVAACFVITSITYGAGFSFGVFLNPLRKSFDTTAGTVSVAYSVALLMFSIFGIIAGLAADRFGPRLTTISGNLCLSLSLLLTSRVDALWQLYAAYGFLGIGMSPVYVSSMAAISRWHKRSRGLALGIVNAGIGFGPLVGAPLGAYLISRSGWRVTYMVMASAVGASMALALLLKEKGHREGTPPENKSKGPALEQTTAPTEGLRRRKTRFELKRIMARRDFWLICLVYLMVGIGIQTLMAHIVAFCETKGVPTMTAAGVLSIISGTSILGRISMGLASDWIGRKKILAVCTMTEGIMILCLIWSSSIWMFVLFGFIFGLFYGGHAPQLPGLVGEILGVSNMGAILGAGIFFWGIGSAIGPSLTGHLLDATGSYSGGFVAAAVAMFLVAVIAFLLRTAGEPD